MSRYRKVDTRVWNDAKFNSLSERGKLVFFFLLTHPNLTMLGGMRAAVPGLAAELGMPAEAFGEAFREALSKGMAKHDPEASFLWLPNFLKYNKPESPNVVKSWPEAFDLLPECAMKGLLLQQLKGFIEGLTEGFQKAFAQAFPEAFAKAMPKTMPNQEQEQEQEQEKDKALPFLPENSQKPAAFTQAAAFVEAWNSLRGDLPKVQNLTSGRRDKLRTRAQRGLTLEQFSDAVKICASTPFLSGHNERKWRADFDWLIANDENLAKVIEGKYGDSLPTSPSRGIFAEPPEPVHEFQSRSIPMSEIRKGLGKGAAQ